MVGSASFESQGHGSAGARCPPDPCYLGGWSRLQRGTAASAIVLELQGHLQVLLTQQLDRLLQVVLVLAGDPQALALDRHGHLLEGVAYRLAELLGQLLAEALAQLHLLLHLVAAHRFGRLEIEDLEREVALGGLLAQHVDHRLQGHVAGGHDRQGPLLEIDRGAGILEVVALAHLAAHLVDGVHQLLAIEVGDHVEAEGVGHGGVRKRRWATQPRKLPW
jgi:hypothetical protein